MADPADGLCSDIQAALGALVVQQRSGHSHEVVQIDVPVGQLKTLFILWTAGKPQTMGQIAQAPGVSLGSVTGLVDLQALRQGLVALATAAGASMRARR
jgi:hypothetical protein